MSKSGWSTAGWTRPSKSKLKPVSSSKYESNPPRTSEPESDPPTRKVKIHQYRPDTTARVAAPTAPTTKSSAGGDRSERRIKIEEKPARTSRRQKDQSERERERKHATKSKATITSESRRSATRLKAETKLPKSKSKKKSSLPGTDTPPVSEEEYKELPVQIQ